MYAQPSVACLTKAVNQYTVVAFPRVVPPVDVHGATVGRRGRRQQQAGAIAHGLLAAPSERAHATQRARRQQVVVGALQAEFR